MINNIKIILDTYLIKTFVDKVRDFSSAHELFVKNGKYIVALSGGADSVSMLYVMKSIAMDFNLQVEAVHCNFHLRGEESNRDEDFCKSLCGKLGVPLHIAHFDTIEYANLHHVSIEMAARDLRYAYFERLRKDICATDICVAHHRDDSVETVLLNLIRGTGLRGLRGIQPRNNNIIRPLLCVSRNEIITFLCANNLSYVTDSTNLHNDVKRNKIRLDILPMLQQLNPSVSNSIFETSLRIGEAIKVYDSAIDRCMEQIVSPMSDSEADGISDTSTMLRTIPIQIDIDRLLCQPSPESMLFHILNLCGFSASQVEQLSAKLGHIKGKHCQSGKTMLSATHELLFDRRRIIIQPINWGVSTRLMRIPETGTYLYSDYMKITIIDEYIDNGYEPSRDRWCVSVDADAISFPLTLRPLRKGERFVPFGMKRAKLVSDFLTDIKQTLFDKQRQLVLTDASDNIVWLVGLRVDNRFRIGNKSARALRVSISQALKRNNI